MLFHNLNFLRLVLALMVTWSHAYPLTAQVEPISKLLPGETGGSIAVKCFFFISGVLITHSAKRLSWGKFIIARVLRIWPALFCSLVLGTILAGLVSSATTREFLTAALGYFYHNLVLIGGVQYTLPGAFDLNPNTSVNGSLWTLPWEIRMYALVLIASLIGLMAKKEVANLFIVIVIISCLSIHNNFVGFPYDNPEARMMVLCFTIGIFVANNYDVSQYGRVSLALFLAGAAIWNLGAHQIGVVASLCGLTLALGFLRIIRFPDISSDLSYGVYVYSFPLQQFSYSYFGLETPGKMLTFVIPAVCFLGYVSWRFVENPSIELNKKIRNRLAAIENQRA